jgi:hypothetical protein
MATASAGGDTPGPGHGVTKPNLPPAGSLIRYGTSVRKRTPFWANGLALPSEDLLPLLIHSNRKRVRAATKYPLLLQPAPAAIRKSKPGGERGFSSPPLHPTHHNPPSKPVSQPFWRKENKLLTLANIRTTTAVLPPRIIIHGREGSGKTTLAAQFPDPIFLQTEDGCPAGLKIATFGVLASYDNLIAAITALGHEPHDYQTVAIDSVDVLESLVWDAVCVANNWKSIESAGYGRGYVEADKQWLDLLAGLDWLRRNRGMMIVLIAHSAVETVNDRRAPSYTSYQLRLHKRGRALLQDWADAIGFLSTELTILSEDQGFRKRTRADGGSARYLHWEGRPSFTAKNRYALPAKMLVPKDFDFAEQLASFFPERAGASASHGQRNNGGDGADRDDDDARTGTTSETTPSSLIAATGEQERNDRRR